MTKQPTMGRGSEPKHARRRSVIQRGYKLRITGLCAIGMISALGIGVTAVNDSAAGATTRSSATVSPASVKIRHTLQAEAALTTASAVPPEQLLAVALSNVGSSAHFHVRDNQGLGMDTLKVVQAGAQYLGVYHNCSTGTCQVRLATSTDLTTWSFRITLDPWASQPYLAVASDGTYVLAVEADSDHHVRFRHYSTLAALMSATSDRRFDAPKTLSRCAEGTPSIRSATATTVNVAMHYFADCQTDREASGVLTNWTTWTAGKLASRDAALTAAGAAGKHGDRDAVRYAGTVLTVYEGQLVNNDQSSWRLYAFNPNTLSATPIKIKTPGGSTAFANPQITVLTTPAGTKMIFVSIFLPVQGLAGTDKPGELTYLVPAG